MMPLLKNLSLLSLSSASQRIKCAYSTADAETFLPPFMLLPEKKEHQETGLITITSCPPQANDALHGQHLNTFKVIWIKMTNDSVNIFSHEYGYMAWTR